MRQRLSKLISAALVIGVMASISTTAYAQGATALSGTVVDASGAVIPGADVTVKNTATGATFSAVTGENGTFTIPSMLAGTYAVTVALMGFKTVVLNDVMLEVGVPASIKATLEVGNMEESVVVAGGTEIVQTQTATVSTTLGVKEINKLPLQTRNAMDFVAGLAGAATTGVNRDLTINGLPQSSLNITMDGINIQDQSLKTDDGFQTFIKPMQDQIEEVTLSSATPGAANAGQGTVQIMYRSRSGSNRLSGSVYEHLRDSALNANYWFNNRDLPPDPKTGKAPKDIVTLHQFGGRLGGPIVIPGFYDGHDKAFFFFNFERQLLTQGAGRQRTVLTPQAQQGLFRYSVAGDVREVNLYDLARANGQTSTPDPVVADLLNDIRETFSQGGLQQLADPNYQQFSFLSRGSNLRDAPAARIDVNLSQRHRLAVSGNHQWIDNAPSNSAEQQFPGFLNIGSLASHRRVWSATLRSSLTKHLVGETIVGFSDQTLDTNFRVKDVDTFSGDALGSNQGGFNLGISAAGITNATRSSSYSRRTHPYQQVSTTLTFNKGSHSIAFGGSFSQISVSSASKALVPSITFGVDASDPANGLFTAANFSGASAAQLTAARNLYAVLTGRVTAITGNAVLDETTGEYSYLGPLSQSSRMREAGLFVQDGWRLRPSLTVNYGLRWELQFPVYPLTSIYSTGTVEDVWGRSGVGNLFKPGVLTGKEPQFAQYQQGERSYNVNWTDFAPSLGIAWRPSAAGGWARRMLGNDDDTVVRLAYSLSYNRLGMADYTDVYSSNPGGTVSANRNLSIGNLGALPLLFRDTSRLGPGAFPESPAFPFTSVVTGSMRIFDENLKTPYAQSWTAGVQRALNQSTAIDVRYVGTRSLQGLTNFNLNELNIVENNFLNEFKAAQANLRSNIAAGRGNSFAYFGPGTGTAPLPIYLAYLTGSAQASDPARYTSSQFTNSTFVNRLPLFNPNPTAAAGDLNGDATRRSNALAAGLPANLFVANPDLLGGAFITGNGGYTRYNSMQVELRRRLSQGLQVQASYVLANVLESTFLSLRVPLAESESENNIRHAFKVNWVYEFPFGRGRHFGSNASGLVEKLIGGWGFSGIGIILSGDRLSFGNVRLVGMTDKELQDVYKLRYADLLYMLPQDIIDNTIKAFSVSATSPTGYGGLGPPSGRYFAPANGPDCIQVVAGDCAPRNHYVTGPAFFQFNLSLIKNMALTSRLNFELRGDFLNAFNNINFNPVAQTGSSQTINQVTSANRETNNTQNFGGRSVQIAARITW